ncbi:MAG: bifunctional phosphoglucose/phosphomannose isomerase [candidate division Zixibacteria bacterium]|nr:bifunctional phosphoglucose/phosphomannose isomerase [candidate division Zixibacteria bacterium]
MFDMSLREIDRNNVYDRIVNFYQQLVDGIEIGRNAKLRELSRGGFSSIVLAGMGGSAITGNLLKSVLLDELTMPFEIHRNYGLPGHIDKDSLIICSSYSGGTEETLSAFDAAIERGCNILSVSTGGKLADKARQNNIPLIKIPSGLMPREALGFSFAPLLTVLGRIGLTKDYTAELKKCAEHLKEWNNQYVFESENNPALDTAKKLVGKIIIIYSGPDRFDSVALRLKGQICENAKQLAFCNVFPEFNHNELVGWELSASYTDKFVVVVLRDKDDHRQIARRMEAVKEILDGKNVEVIELFSKGSSALERIFSLIQIADFISYYMALINKVDPTPVNLIDYLKQRLAK